MTRTIIAAALLLIAFAQPATAGDLITFRTPSNNIHCMGQAEGESGAVVDCEMVEIGRFTLQLKRPKDCEQDWGQRFSLSDRDGPTMGCYGDTVRDPSSRLLRYGKSLRIGPLTCASTKKGLTCEDGGGHGFFLSKREQRFY
jgi:hypothetical protein